MRFEIDRKQRLKWAIQDLLLSNGAWFLILAVATIVVAVISGRAE